MRKNKLLGQHFLVSEEPVKKIISEARKEPPVETVLEVGSGKGILTRYLCSNFKKVVAVEKDRALAEYLKGSLEVEKIKNCEIIAGDILKTDFQEMLGKKSYAVIANIPYYLTSRLIRTFLEAVNPPAYMIIMVQREVAERITAEPPEMNLLALSVQAYGKVKIVAYVLKKEFAPPPAVDSSIIKISSISKHFFVSNKISEKDFFAVLRAAFSQKRKTLANSLSKLMGGKQAAEKIIKSAGLSLTTRPQELSLWGWVKLIKAANIKQWVQF